MIEEQGVERALAPLGVAKLEWSSESFLKDHERMHGWAQDSLPLVDERPCPTGALERLQSACSSDGDATSARALEYAAQVLERNGRVGAAREILERTSAGAPRAEHARFELRQARWLAALAILERLQPDDLGCGTFESVQRTQWTEERARCLLELGRIDALESLALDKSTCAIPHVVLEAWRRGSGSQGFDAMLEKHGARTWLDAKQLASLEAAFAAAARHDEILRGAPTVAIDRLDELDGEHDGEVLRRVFAVGDRAIDELVERAARERARDACDRPELDALAASGDPRAKSSLGERAAASTPCDERRWEAWQSASRLRSALTAAASIE